MMTLFAVVKVSTVVKELPIMERNGEVKGKVSTHSYLAKDYAKTMNKKLQEAKEYAKYIVRKIDIEGE